ncbi:ABC transporter permease [Piscinibacter sakaiensis]|uniref:Dipeptide transport system permease protein DppC n=1 Tax=Piscinibacter sakaiensis TaxID=1547922 RepID=A0A0K8P6A3_PISS1|nr:ABC transporter permease [Piscinibacter sakaiensis]GAP38203.1 dipeptide transport system permease protein DppC [Piscinibacter sakaiensis]
MISNTAQPAPGPGIPAADAAPPERPPSSLRRWTELPPGARVSLATLAGIAAAAAFAPWLAPHTPFDPATLDLADALLPPAWMDGGRSTYLLGTDEQGRDLLSVLMYGSRISLVVAAASVLVSMLIGVLVGMVAGYFGGWLDGLLMRVVDVQLTLPSILLALFLDGVARAALPKAVYEELALVTLTLAIGLSQWPRFARLARSRTLVQRGAEYVAAARIVGVTPLRIMASHILPNASAPILVLLTVDFGIAVLNEASLSFLGVGAPPTSPSLGTLVRTGTDILFSGQWWPFAMPALVLVLLVLSVNTLGDALRDVLNPRLLRRV